MTMQHEAKRPMFPVWSLGDRLRKARLVAAMDQREFADAIGVKPGSLAAWETDRQTPRNLVELTKTIEKVTGVPAAWTLGVSEPTQPKVRHSLVTSGQQKRTSIRSSSFRAEPRRDGRKA